MIQGIRIRHPACQHSPGDQILVVQILRDGVAHILPAFADHHLTETPFLVFFDSPFAVLHHDPPLLVLDLESTEIVLQLGCQFLGRLGVFAVYLLFQCFDQRFGLSVTLIHQ